MTTARDWITSALYANGSLTQGETLAAEDAAIALARLNMMLDSWSLEPGTVWALDQDSFTMTPAVASYSTSLLAGGRPQGIKSVRVSLSGIDWPVMSNIDETTYNAIGYKAAAGIPTLVWVNNTMPDATMYFWPTPYAAFTATVACWGLLQGPLTLDTVITTPPGYDLAVVDNLALLTCSSFGRTPSQELKESAKASKAIVKRSNSRPREMLTGLPTASRNRRFNIYGDN